MSERWSVISGRKTGRCPSRRWPTLWLAPSRSPRAPCATASWTLVWLCHDRRSALPKVKQEIPIGNPPRRAHARNHEEDERQAVGWLRRFHAGDLSGGRELLLRDGLHGRMVRRLDCRSPEC